MRQGPAPLEYADYVLMTKLWHCTPTEFLKQPEDLIDLHIRIYSEEIKADYISAKREEQDRKLSK